MQPNTFIKSSSDRLKDWSNRGQTDKRKQTSTCENTESTKKVKYFSFETGAIQEKTIFEKDKYVDTDPLYKPQNANKVDCLPTINPALAWPKNQWTNGVDSKPRPRGGLDFNLQTQHMDLAKR